VKIKKREGSRVKAKKHGVGVTHVTIQQSYIQRRTGKCYEKRTIKDRMGNMLV
jgi:hypothetical protein